MLKVFLQRLETVKGFFAKTASKVITSNLRTWQMRKDVDKMMTGKEFEFSFFKFSSTWCLGSSEIESNIYLLKAKISTLSLSKDHQALGYIRSWWPN